MTAEQEVVARYAKLGLRARLYAKGRWLTCPFEEMEGFLPKEGELVDLGCGEGVFSSYVALREPKRRVRGVDANEARIALARRAAEGLSNVRFEAGDALHAQLPERLAGASVSDFLHHVSEDAQRELFRRIAARLAPGGAFVIKEVYCDELLPRALGRFYDFLLYPRDAIQYHTSEEWLERLETVGLSGKSFGPIVQGPLIHALLVGVKK